MPLHNFEVSDLFAAMIVKPEPETDDEVDALEQQFIEDFGVDFSGLVEIAERLLPPADKSQPSNELEGQADG